MKKINVTISRKYTYLVNDCEGKTMKEKRKDALEMAMFDLKYNDIDLLGHPNVLRQKNYPFKIKIN